MFDVKKYNVRLENFRSKRLLKEDEGDVRLYMNPADYFKFSNHPASDAEWDRAHALLVSIYDDRRAMDEIHNTIKNILKRKMRPTDIIQLK